MVRLILTLLACWGAPEEDPELARVGAAVQAFEAGREALDEGDAAGARAHFAEARTHRPQDALLTAWEGEAAALAGDAEGATDLLDAAIAAAPDLGAARWRRARLRVDAGDLDGAADDLRAAIAAGAVSPREAVRPWAFGAHRDAPELAFLPEAPVAGELVLPTGTTFLGSEASLELTLHGFDDAPVRIEAPDDPLSATLVRVEEEVVVERSGDVRRTLTWTWRMAEDGEVAVPRLRVTQDLGDDRVLALDVPGGTFLAAAPPGSATGPGTTWRFPTVAEALAGVAPPAAWRSGEGWRVALPPGGRVTSDRGVRPGPAWRLRRGDEAVELVTFGDDPGELTIRVGGDVAWRGTVPP